MKKTSKKIDNSRTKIKVIKARSQLKPQETSSYTLPFDLDVVRPYLSDKPLRRGPRRAPRR